MYRLMQSCQQLQTISGYSM